MREPKNSRRTVVKGSNVMPKKKYFLVFEGVKTEEIYFNAIKNKLSHNALVDIIPLIKNNSEAGFSNPEKMLEMIISNLNEQQSQVFSYQTLTDWIIAYIKDNNILNIQEKTLKDILIKICKEKIKVKPEDTVKQINLNNKLERILKFLEDYVLYKWKSNIEEIIEEIIESGKIEYVNGYDEIAIIADRDRGSFTVEQYEKLVKDCNRKKIKLFITNPCFEFWLLMHFDAVKTINCKTMLQNPKISGNITFCHDVLRNTFDGYKKEKYNAVLLMSKLSTAINNEKLFCEDIIGLKTNIGSNIGLLIEELGFKSS